MIFIKSKHIVFLFLLYLFTPALIKAQIKGEITIERILENILENASEEFDYSELRDQLMFLHLNPLSLNTATTEELSALFFLSQQQIDDILNYRRRHLGFKSIYELKLISSLDQQTIYNLLPFVNVDIVEKRRTLKTEDLFLNGRSNLIIKSERLFEKQAGYLPPSDSSKQYYLGSPYKLYARYTYSFHNLVSYGLLMEKDAGEEFFKGSQKQGFDFYSFHFFRRNMGKVTSLALGDYYARFGQGLVFYSGFAFGKSPYVVQSFKKASGLAPYRSVNENAYLRGGGISLKLGSFDLSLFASSKKIDGNINVVDSFENNEDHFFSSFYTTGLHRTPNEIAYKNTIRESLGGFNITKSLSKARIGWTTVGGIYSVPVKSSDMLYNIYRFSGSQFFNTGIDYSWSYRNVHFFGESAYGGESFAHIHGALINMGDNVNGGIIYRRYPNNYSAPYANAFRESTLCNNEEGLYLALSFSPARRIKVNTYFDRFSFRWLKYLTDAPSSGVDFFSDLTYTPSYNTQHYFRFRYVQKERNLSYNETKLNYLVPHTRRSFRYQLTYRLSRQFTLVTRLEYNQYGIDDNTPFNGFFSMQDVKYLSLNGRFRLVLRYAFFNADSYYSRLYAFENDIPTSFSITSFYDKGMRVYALSSYKISDQITFWIKLSQTNYLEKDSIGSSLTKIEGNKRTEVRGLLNITF